MDTIPSEYWMVVITIVAAFVCFVLYQLAMLLRESKDAVTDSRKIIVEAESTLIKANSLVDEATGIVESLKDTASDVNRFVSAPLRRITNILTVVGGLVGGVKTIKNKR